jgi:2-polyprenyl-6-methoxyphenol hydroxylase-like FAD-dependent oxidoreductase
VIPRASDADRRVARELWADLVVDTTGRASRAPRWLQELGCEPPKETVINAHLGYASRLYRIPENFNGGWTCAYVQSAPPKTKRGGILFRVEGDRWLVTLIGGARDYPPSDEQAFVEFAESLRDPIIADAIRSAQPVSPIRTHRGTENRVRHFDGVNLPENFVVLGDAACAFNPVYGQGMTIASLGALALRECLRERDGLRGLSRRFQRRLAKVNKAPWLMATGEDYRYPETEGGSPGVMTRFMHWYMDRVMQLATRDIAVRSVLLQVFNLLIPPPALFRRFILFAVIREALNRTAAPVPEPRATAPRARTSGQRVLYDSRH